MSGDCNTADHGATWVKHGDGSAWHSRAVMLVDCGLGEPGPPGVTLSACVRSDGRQTREGALILKDPESYGLTLYLDGNIYFYVGGGGHNLKAPFPVAEGEPGFHHIAAACDGETMRLYIDGRPAGQRPQELPLKPGGNLYLGRGNDPGTSLQGALDEVRVYNRALSETEIRAEYRALSGAGLVTVSRCRRSRGRSRLRSRLSGVQTLKVANEKHPSRLCDFPPSPKSPATSRVAF